MNRNFVITTSTAIISMDFFACGIVMPEIIYHGLRSDR